MDRNQTLELDRKEAQKMTVPARAKQSGQLSPRWRNTLLTVHIVISVSVIGADITAIMLSITGLTSRVPELIRASYLVMGLLAEKILVPFALAALLTGILLGLGTRWGLTRYYWVLTKLLLTITAISALVLVLRPRVSQAADEVLRIPLAELATNGIGQIGIGVTIGIAAALLVLLTVAILAVNKPWGKIRLRKDSPASE
jgi:hypothetical protein